MIFPLVVNLNSEIVPFIIQICFSFRSLSLQFVETRFVKSLIDLLFISCAMYKFIISEAISSITFNTEKISLVSNSTVASTEETSSLIDEHAH